MREVPGPLRREVTPDELKWLDVVPLQEDSKHTKHCTAHEKYQWIFVTVLALIVRNTSVHASSSMQKLDRNNYIQLTCWNPVVRYRTR